MGFIRNKSYLQRINLDSKFMYILGEISFSSEIIRELFIKIIR